MSGENVKEKSSAPFIIAIILVVIAALAIIAYFLWSNRVIEYPGVNPISVTTAVPTFRETDESEETDEFGEPINDDDMFEEEEIDEIEDEGKDEVERAEKVDHEDRGGGEKHKE